MATETIKLGRLVRDRRTNAPRWAVSATFARGARGDGSCVEYRVLMLAAGISEQQANAVLDQMHDEAPTDVEQLGEIPAAGIPRYVFEQASQTQLLAEWQRLVAKDPEFARQIFTEEAVQMSLPQRSRTTGKRQGRPPVRSLEAKLRILADVEAEYASTPTGPVLDGIARKHHISRSALRDLLHWARHDADPPLFTLLGPGRRGGMLTPQARQMLSDSGRAR